VRRDESISLAAIVRLLVSHRDAGRPEVPVKKSTTPEDDLETLRRLVTRAVNFGTAAA
jgi:hypothetical protein